MAWRLHLLGDGSTSCALDFMNFSRAGVAKKRSRTSTRAPGPEGGGPGLAHGAAVDRQRPGAVGARRRREVMVKRPPSRSRAAPRRGSRACGCRVRSSAGQLGGGVALDRERQLVRAPGRSRRRPPRMRVRPPSFSLDVDAPGAGVERVLDQLLDRAGRPLDHLAGGDAVDRLEGRRRSIVPLFYDFCLWERAAGPASRPPTGWPTTMVVIASSRSRRRATRCTSSALTAPISAARRSR